MSGQSQPAITVQDLLTKIMRNMLCICEYTIVREQKDLENTQQEIQNFQQLE